uniref:Neural proliferation differentiation and control protein 1 n=1 Tax=Syphacia muris TaxID=451379 RepID=A0A0N5AYJ9_9BILA
MMCAAKLEEVDKKEDFCAISWILRLTAVYKQLIKAANTSYFMINQNFGRNIYYNDDEDFNEQLSEIVREIADSPSVWNGDNYQPLDYVGKSAGDGFVEDDELENYLKRKSENINEAAGSKAFKKGNEKVKNKSVEEKKNERTTLPITKQQQSGLPQKKGQNEFVGFVEPKPEKQLKHLEQLEKRVESSRSRVYTSPIGTSGNLLLACKLESFSSLAEVKLRDTSDTNIVSAVATVCLVAAVLGVVGGAYYFHKVRSQRIEDAFSNFSHYAPTGPGKEKKKKDGDEGLAYRAQLHHYQQTKQKIISGSEQDIGIPEPDDASEASDYDENNFSVYECPGLAPTGDIEVQNPNFTRP